MRSKIVTLIILCVLILAVIGLWSAYTSVWRGRYAAEAEKVAAISTVTIGDKTLSVGVADTFDARARGLSDTLSLPQDRGLLFVFDSDKKWGFWMKDMHYPIDMIWISASSTIIDVVTNASPDSYPKTFFPKKNARYVLEANVGFFEKTGANIGDGAKITVGNKNATSE